MLQNLYIKNYALIDKINLDFGPGLSIITGETGAGKSILLGGLELIRGKRTQQGLLKNTAEKSIVEATFDIEKYGLKDLFVKEDLDYEPETIIRRELLPSGKSRAFINDSPARLDSLTQITGKLLDIHSQHQTLELNQKTFQFELLDAISGNQKLLQTYYKNYKTYQSFKKTLSHLEEKLSVAEKELAYKKFQLDELNSAKLDDINLEDLENQIKKIDNQALIKEVLNESLQKLDQEETGILSHWIEIKNAFQKINHLDPAFKELSDRFESLHWEIKDIIDEIQPLIDLDDFDPAKQQELQERYALVNKLMLKHQVLTLEELIDLRNNLADEVTDLSSLEEQIAEVKRKLASIHQKLVDDAAKLHQNRAKNIPKLIKQIEEILTQLSMGNTRLKIDLQAGDEFYPNGRDQLQFLISSDKGHSFGPLKKIASGGELSRLMLAVKTVLSKYKKLPTIIFDEIDTGISGEVAQNMGEVLKKLAQNMQVIVITHLPQIAVKGDTHYKVFKTSQGDEISSRVQKLNKEQRILEIAQMLEGKSPSDSALEHAKHLLGY